MPAVRFVVAALFVSALLTGGCAEASISVGAINRDKAPAKADLAIPSSDDGVPVVQVRERVSASLAASDKRKVFVLVCPIGNSAVSGTWWVQESVSREGDECRCSAQFGEEGVGNGEYFAIVAIATDQNLEVGQRVEGLPEGVIYSSARIVKRAK